MTDYTELIGRMRNRADSLYKASRFYDGDAEDAAILYKAADAIEELQFQRDLSIHNYQIMATAYEETYDLVPSWIPVTEKLPEKYDPVLVYSPTGIMVDAYIGVYDGKDYFGMNTYHVTHWMPLPAPPKEETE